MNRLCILMTILVIALSATVLYYVIRFNNLKNLLGTELPGLMPVKLEDRIKALQSYAASYDNLDAGLEAMGALDFPDTDEITVETVKPMLAEYRSNRKTGDTTETILFDWPLIIQAMKQIYGVSGTQWDSLPYWRDKGFIIYPANYGAAGNASGQYVNQTTAIFQLARKDASTPSDLNDWEALLGTNNKVYDFGDLMPPKNKIK